MSLYQLSGGRNGLTLPALLVVAVASALTGAVVALVAQRFAERRRVIEVLPAPASVGQLQDRAVTGDLGGSRRDAMPAAAPATRAPSPLDAVSAKLTAARIAELERLLAEDDVVAGDGSATCPAEFPIKANGRSGIYHWPGALAYGQTHPTLCFRTAASADQAGFRPAQR